MAKCKLNNKYTCVRNECNERCDVFRKVGQQTFAPPPEPKGRVVKKKGYTVTYRKVEK